MLAFASLEVVGLLTAAGLALFTSAPPSLVFFPLSSPLVSGAPAAIASACLPPDTSAEDLQAKVLPEVLDMRSLSKASTSRLPALAFSHIVPVDYEYE